MSQLFTRILLAVIVAAVAIAGVFFIGNNIVETQRERAAKAAAAEQYNSTLPISGSSASAEAEATAPPEPVEPVAAWFTGDSLTVGWHATTEAEAFRSVVVSELGEGITDTTVTARAGATLQEVATDYEIPAEVGLIVVELGTNDAAQGTDPAVFADQYNTYLDEIRAVNPDAELLCLGVWFLSSRAETAPLDNAIQSSCEAHEGTFEPLTDIVADATLRGPDGAETWVGPADSFHPNSAGHARIADRILGAIR